MERGGCVAGNIEKFNLGGLDSDQKNELFKALYTDCFSQQSEILKMFTRLIHEDTFQSPMIAKFREILFATTNKIREKDDLDDAAKEKRILEIEHQLIPFFTKAARSLIGKDKNERETILNSGLIEAIVAFRVPAIERKIDGASCFVSSSRSRCCNEGYPPFR